MFFKKKNKKVEKTTVINHVSADWQYIYTVHDKIAGRCVGTWLGTSDEVMLRVSLPHILMDFSFRDIEILRIARVDMVTGFVESIVPKPISLDCYLFPHSRLSPKGEDIDLETLDKSMKDLNVKMKANLDKKIENQIKENNKSEVVNE